MRTDTRLPEVEGSVGAEAPRRTDRSLMVGLAVAAVWIAVGAMSLFTPDSITGTEREHVPLAALTGWFWAVIATGFITMTGAMGRTLEDGRWRGLALTIGLIWAVVAVVSIFGPVLVTGTDPTEIPLAALIAPFAGVLGTAFACLFAAGASRA